jgi:hypothetical protein
MLIHKLWAVDQKGSYICWSWTKMNMAFLLTKGRVLSVDENWHAHDNDMFRPCVLTISRIVSHANIAKLIGPIFMKFEGLLQFSQDPANSRIWSLYNIILQPNISRVSAEPPAVRKDFFLSTLSLLPSPSSRDSVKTNCENRMFGNSFWHLCWQIYSFFGKKNLRLSVMLWAFLSHGNLIKLNSQKFRIGQPTKVNPFSFSDQSLEGKVLEFSPRRVGGGGRCAEGTLSC